MRNKTQKLTEIQSRACLKLNTEWQSAYALNETMATMDALVKKGIARVRTVYVIDPKLSKEYRKVGKS